MHRIPIELLTKAAFSPFGDVIETDFADAIVINGGFALRADDLAQIDVAASGGTVNVSLLVAKARQRPIKVTMMERHPLSSQLILPLQERSWLVLVCTDPLVPASFRAFEASGRQGVNYARNVWHHPLLVLDDDERFLVIDRKGPGNNLEEVWVDDPIELAGLEFRL
jgi:ureidoglycolate lyase